MSWARVDDSWARHPRWSNAQVGAALRDTDALWAEVLVDRDHLHTEAKNCAPRPGDACRVCCRAHDDDPRIAELEPEDSDWRAEDRARARAAVWVLAAAAVAVAVAVVSALTLRGVIPS